jgi:hypothetical protein
MRPNGCRVSCLNSEIGRMLVAGVPRQATFSHFGRTPAVRGQQSDEVSETDAPRSMGVEFPTRFLTQLRTGIGGD